MTAFKRNPASKGNAGGVGKSRRCIGSNFTKDHQSKQRAAAEMLGRPIEFDRINAAALAVLPAVCLRLFPAGRIEGAEFCVGSLKGEPGRSLKINLRKGCWRDFASGVGGSDPVSLVAAVEAVSMAEAARLLAQMVGVDHAR